MKKRLSILLLAGVAAIAAAVAANVYLSSATREESRKAIKIGKPTGGRIEKTDEEWRAILSPEIYKITRAKGTERAFCGGLWDAKGDGVYECICCGQPLFDSNAKFDSKTGWPSFFQPSDEDAVSLFEDPGPLGVRIEVECSRCDAHLGHVFHDGPKPTGLRYCLNSAAIRFVPRADAKQP